MKWLPTTSTRASRFCEAGGFCGSRSAAAAPTRASRPRRFPGPRIPRGEGPPLRGDFRAHVSASPESGESLRAAESRDEATLASLKFKSIISVHGEVHPEEREGVESSVFAVFDQAKQLQFVGFSKHLKNSLRTMLGRQGDLVYYYKHVDFPDINQEAMMGLRDAWFKENSGMPPGNTAEKRQYWQQPLAAGGVSERGKLVAAKQMLETIQKKLEQRGLREDFLPDEALLKEGKVDFLPARELTEEERRRKEEERQRVLEATRRCSTVVDGTDQPFMLFFENFFEANGGGWTWAQAPQSADSPILSLSLSTRRALTNLPPSLSLSLSPSLSPSVCVCASRSDGGRDCDQG